MKPILYWYPLVYLNDDPEDRVTIRAHGRITECQLEHEPYEAVVEACGSSFHLVFGHKESGMFLCIPDWNIGCEVAELSDRRWNLKSLMKTGRLDYEKSNAIVWALYNIGSLLRFIR